MCAVTERLRCEMNPTEQILFIAHSLLRLFLYWDLDTYFLCPQSIMVSLGLLILCPVPTA